MGWIYDLLKEGSLNTIIIDLLSSGLGRAADVVKCFML